MGLTGVLDIAKTALLVSQTAIQTTSHNIANVNTPGYTRQRANLAAGEPVVGGGYYIGTGVVVTGVERVYDSFLGLQILDATGMMGRYTSMNDTIGRLEGVFNDQQGLGLGDTLNGFFNALEDVANDPSSYSARTVLLGKAQTLADRINDLDLRIRQEIRNIESEIKGKVEEVNSLTGRIATLNSKIQRLEVGGERANDLRDKRDSLVKDLAEIIGITVLEDNGGQLNILVVGGGSLVAGNSTTSLSVSGDPDNNGYYDIMLGNHDITTSISSGRLKGLLEARDTHYQDALTRLNTLAASLTKEFNVIHGQGYGLDGSTGLDLFTPLSPSITPKSSNTGGATATVSIQTLSSLTLDDYEIRFTSSSTFDIVNTTKGTTVSSGNTYTSGANIDFEGIRVVITNGTDTPKSGDVFKVSVTRDASKNLGLSLTDPNKFAAAKSSSALPGDNSNVLDMVNLKDSKVLSNGGATFNSFYSSLVSDIGGVAKEASINNDAQTQVLGDLEAYRQSVSGVSLDEEATNLIKYQYAYQAAAKVITVVDSLLETLMGLR